MKLLYNNRNDSDKSLIYHICTDLHWERLDLDAKLITDEWAYVFVEGRPDIEINYLEHFSCFKACKLYAEYNTPIYCFVNNTKNFLNNNKWLIDKWKIHVIEIQPITTHKAFSDFCIHELYFKLPSNIKHVITVSADSWPLRSGFEQWILDNKYSIIGPALRHLPALDVKTTQGWQPMLFNVPIGINGGFSYRNASLMRLIPEKFKNYKFKERFSADFERVNEDLYYFYLAVGSGLAKCPTIEDCNYFGRDPL